MRTKTIEVFKFTELDESDKEAARTWYREGALDHEWWDAAYDDAKTIAAKMGIEIENIWFTGFWSQGDGACFDGEYSYKKGAAKAVTQYAPLDQELRSIVDALQEVQRRNFYRLSAKVERNYYAGNHVHEMTRSITVYDDGGELDAESSADDIESVAEALRDLMRWIYSRLESEYEWLMSDETVDENIVINEYEFHADGSIA